jgi:hypothetical protein
MKNEFSFTKIGMMMTMALIILCTIGVSHSFGQQTVENSSSLANDHRSKQELEMLKTELSLTKEQEVRIYELLVYKNQTLALPDQTSPRIPLALGRVSEEMTTILTKEQVNKLRNNSTLVSSLNLNFNK